MIQRYTITIIIDKIHPENISERRKKVMIMIHISLQKNQKYLIINNRSEGIHHHETLSIKYPPPQTFYPPPHPPPQFLT
tara:strand:- start:129 stop:365 length:237 start_codon:yes stop_codon:yes gene_type:complete